MLAAFYTAGAIAILATLLTLTRLEAVHALLYLVVSLLAVAVVFFALGAPFIGALEIIVYAGAIMVLFVFAVMMLNLGRAAVDAERALLPPRAWLGPSGLAAVLLGLLAYAVSGSPEAGSPQGADPREVGAALFGPYALGVELASLLLTGALVGAYHLGVQQVQKQEVPHGAGSDQPRALAGGDPVRPGAGGAAGAA